MQLIFVPNKYFVRTYKLPTELLKQYIFLRSDMYILLLKITNSLINNSF